MKDEEYRILLAQMGGPNEQDRAQARSMGIMRAGMGILAASGPSLLPAGLGGILAQGGMQGMDGYAGALKDATTTRRASTLTAMQLLKLKQEEAERTRTNNIRNAVLSQMGFGPDGQLIQAQQPPAPQGQPPMDQAGISPGGLPPSAVMTGAPAAPWMPQQQQQPQGQPPASADGSRRKYSFVDAGSEPPNPLQSKRSPFGPNINQQAALMALSGDAGLGKIGQWMQEADKPHAVAEGGALVGRDGRIIHARPKLGENVLPVLDAQGNVVGVRPMPGAADATAAITGAQEGARAAYDLIPVPDGRGGTVMLPRSVAAARLGGGAQQTGRGGIPHLGQQQPGRGPGNIPGLPSQQAGGIDPRTLPQIGGMGYQRPAAEAGADAEFQKQLAGEFAKNYADLLRSDAQAPNNISKYQRLGSLLSGVKTGKFTGTTIQIKAAAKAAGIDMGALGVADDVPQAQAAMALSNQLAIELRNPAGGAGMPGALSDKDREFLVAMVPGLENDPASIPLMIEYRVKLAQREQQVAKMARAYKKKHGRFDDGFFEELAQWSDKNTLFPRTPKAAPGGVPAGFRVLGAE